MNLDHVHPDCREFVAAIEEFLVRRQEDAPGDTALDKSWQDDAWGPRTWTRTEMEDMVYSSYKQMRQGRITRPPRREVVMDIADYLNCTLEERNRLLIAAHAIPVSPYLTGEKLETLLQITRPVARSLMMPAAIINRDWNIHFLNDQLIALYALTEEQIAAVPIEKFNLLQLMFDPNLPLYPNLIENAESWTRMARQTIYGFKMANQLCQFEGWYQRLVAQLLTLPNFEYHWTTVRLDVPFDEDSSVISLSHDVLVETALPALRVQSRRAWMRPLIISAGYFQFDFPQIIAFLPANEQSQSVFAEIGVLGLGNP